MCFATTDEIGSVTYMTTTKNEIMSKNGNLMGFATTDEIGSVTDMTKTKSEIRIAIKAISRRAVRAARRRRYGGRIGRREWGTPAGRPGPWMT